MATAAECRKALDLHAEDLERRENVVGLGVVPLKDDDGGPMAVAVYVRRLVPAKDQAPKDRIPKMLEVPTKRGPVKVPTRIIEQGEVELESFGFE